jgi:hypothetical protein
MLANPNVLQWQGQPGHYEVYYLTLTDPRSGVGIWIRYTMIAPIAQGAEPATCALWLLAMDPREGHAARFGRKATFPISMLQARADPFELRINDATLSDAGARGAFEAVGWELRWAPAKRSYEHVNPVLRRSGVAQTVLVLPGADLTIEGSVTLRGERLEISAARGGQAHLWGSKHARSWAWVHCNDFTDLGGTEVPDTFVDGVSVFVSRLGRTLRR